jgi:hypothetical protein
MQEATTTGRSPMKRSLISMMSLVVLFAIGAGVANATHGDGAKTKVKFESAVSINYKGAGAADPDDPYDPYDPYGPGAEARIAGKVTSERKKCRKERTVLVKRELAGKDETVDSDVTNNKGRYVVGQGDGATPGSYYAKAKKRKIEKNHKIIVCRKARSETTVVP